MSDATRPSRDAWVGAGFALAAFGAWAVVPAYWKAVQHVDEMQLLAHRTVWCFVFLALWLGLRGKGKSAWALLRDPRRLRWLVATAALIAVNWLTFIWAVANDRVLEASLGYYVNPLVNVVLGVLFLGERLRRWQAAAVLLAAIGVTNLALAGGSLPWVSLVLAATFGMYGLLRKIAPVEPTQGLLVETALLLPPALAFLTWAHAHGQADVGRGDRASDLLVLASGLVTALPLIWFTKAARRLRYATLGLFQYVAPSGHFLLAVLAFGEVLTRAHAVTFGCIWTALVLYGVGGRRTEPVPPA